MPIIIVVASIYMGISISAAELLFPSFIQFIPEHKKGKKKKKKNVMKASQSGSGCTLQAYLSYSRVKSEYFLFIYLFILCVCGSFHTLPL